MMIFIHAAFASIVEVAAKSMYFLIFISICSRNINSQQFSLHYPIPVESKCEFGGLSKCQHMERKISQSFGQKQSAHGYAIGCQKLPLCIGAVLNGIPTQKPKKRETIIVLSHSIHVRVR